VVFAPKQQLHEEPMNSIRFGVIGLNRGQSFVKACRVVGGATVTALYDVDAGRVHAAAAELDAKPFTDFAAFLNSPIDAVVVASPLPFHAAQSAMALAADKHVLSEVTACTNHEDAQVLVEATRHSTAVYMLSENYRYLDEVELLKRMHDDGRFGEVYFAEGEYLHDCRGIYINPDGSLTWRGKGGLGVYCTHSLGPLLYILNDRVTSVSALAVPGGKFDSRVMVPTMHVMQMATAGGRVFRVRVDHTSPRPHQMAYYALQGTQGSYEAWRGFGDQSKVWLDHEHEPSLFHAPAQWHALDEQAQRYIPDRLVAPPEARAGGHGTSEYWLLRDFVAAVRGERLSPIDVYTGLDYTLPGICAVESAKAGGVPIAVPDPRES
jgi:predicted dehydrogenase